ncbi:MAG TPA: molybdopterin-dependent oxidoreductase [Candidatus Baltobacteraceae bacterium]|jgi:DMSO/TMAO reductase YedYZ molybdopterin-dependent catalytic subunit|nr:molybdopterin-dependent oxidoreductase [Candidatus Baltobacteraceae bacterium]
MKRKLFLASTMSSALAACSPIGTALNNNERFHNFLGSAESVSHLAIGTRGLAREYSDADVDRTFRVNGLATPSDTRYMDLLADHYRSYRLVVDGAVERRHAFTLAELHAMKQMTQITRHDCVEGWSAIGKWSGVPLGDLLAHVHPRADARYVVFHCLDKDDQGSPYYESLDLQQARHPQTLLAMRLNDAPLDADHGAPVRLRIPTQLGYKSAKWVARIEVVGSFANLYAGNGGYWEDQGYSWYAGI